MPGAIAMKSQNIPETIGSTLLAILPDTGERYITTRLWGW
jgi:cysteine synthase